MVSQGFASSIISHETDTRISIPYSAFAVIVQLLTLFSFGSYMKNTAQ
jgi:hypothetical protein